MDYVQFDVKIPKMEKWVADKLRQTAKSATSEGTMRAYLQKILKEEALSNQRKAYDLIISHQKEMAVKYPDGTGTDAVVLVRSIRDER